MMQKFCTHCGKKLDEVLRFCTYCGAPLGIRPLNPKLVLEPPDTLETEERPSASDEVREASAEDKELDFKPLQAAVLRKEVPAAEPSARAGETTEEGTASPIVKAAAITTVAAGTEETDVDSPAAEESPKIAKTAAEHAPAGDGLSSLKSPNAAATADETKGDAPAAAGSASASDVSATTVASDVSAASLSEEEKRAAAAAVPAARSGTLAGCLLRLLLIIVFILGVLMVFRGVSFDKLMNEPADAVRQMLGKVPIDSRREGSVRLAPGYEAERVHVWDV